MPQLLAARSRAAEHGGPHFGRAKSCIVCFLFGAPAHQDIWDLKPDAPDDVRGPFSPIATSVPGTWLSEHIPRTAKLADRLALVRSVTHPDSTHTVAMHYMLTGQRHRRPAGSHTTRFDRPQLFHCFEGEFFAFGLDILRLTANRDGGIERAADRQARITV
jgi:Protein of unknown function (DUF1501)